MKEENKYTKEIFTSTDLGVVASLYLKFPIEETRKKASGRIEFVFINSPELEDYIELYWRKELLVEPQELLQSIKTIRSITYEV